MKEKGIFISYRRDTGSTMARMVYDRMRLEKGYQCFLDVEKLNAGDFKKNIANEIAKCDIFILILSSRALERCSNPNDNVRQEILAALSKKLNIIPVTSEDFDWPETMPEGLERIKNYNAIPYVQVYSDQFFDRLYSFIENIRNEGKEKEAKTVKQEVKPSANETSVNAPKEKSVKEKKPGSAKRKAILIASLICTWRVCHMACA